MKKLILAGVIVVILLVTGYYLVTKKIHIRSIAGSCVVEETKGELVPVATAQTFALNHVRANNTPYDWALVGYYPVYSSSDTINYYSFIFRKKDFNKYTSLNSLEQNAAQSSDDQVKYQFNDIASVWTGASFGQKLLMRHYRGIPEIIANKIDIKNYVENTYPGKTIGNLISDSESGKMYFDIIDTQNSKTTGTIIATDYSIATKDQLRQIQNSINERRYSSLSGDRCEKIKQAVAAREEEFKKQWSNVGN